VRASMRGNTKPTTTAPSKSASSSFTFAPSHAHEPPDQARHARAPAVEHNAV
jgi:hypothetical protein